MSSVIILTIFLVTLWTSGASEAPKLSPFIRHYEMLNYDLDAVHQQHRRAVRSVGGPPGPPGPPGGPIGLNDDLDAVHHQQRRAVRSVGGPPGPPGPPGGPIGLNDDLDAVHHQQRRAVRSVGGPPGPPGPPGGPIGLNDDLDAVHHQQRRAVRSVGGPPGPPGPPGGPIGLNDDLDAVHHQQRRAVRSVGGPPGPPGPPGGPIGLNDDLDAVHHQQRRAVRSVGGPPGPPGPPGGPIGLNDDLDAVHHQQRRAVRSLGWPPGPPGEPIRLTFTAHKRDFHLRLKRDTSVFLPSVTLETSSGEEVPDVSYFYSGELVGEEGSYCHGSITDGLFQGKIHVGNETYAVEPASKYLKNPESHSVIYKATDLDYSSLQRSSGCGLVGKIQKRMEERMKKMEKEEQEDQKLEGVHHGNGSSFFARHKRQATVAQTCTMYIQTDIEFYERFGSKSAVVQQIGEHVQAASAIYSRTDFGNYQDINFAVAKIRIYTDQDRNSADYPFRDPNLGVEKYLDYASNGDWSDYCLAYTFTNRDFANGVLGLAWIATTVTRSTGGLCAPQLSNRDTTLNTGIVTTNNYGAFVPSLMSHNTFAHEIGHSFGSNHDSAEDQVCSPGGTSGNYLMYAFATSGALSNNDDFSTCSIREMTSVLESVFDGVSKTNCFVELSAVTLCGNEVLEEGEMCDCGYEETCTDDCCIAQNADNTRVNACQLQTAATCSGQQGDCCNPKTCTFRSTNYQCKMEDECSLRANCPGNSYNCGTPQSKPDQTTCDRGRKVCKTGVCSDSVCKLSNLEECQCTGDNEKCELCCQNIDQPQSCVAASRINIVGQDGKVLYKDVGSPCDNFMGYCDVFEVCRLANEDGPLAAIIRKIFFNEEDQLTDVIWTWIKANWWVIVIIIVILIIVMALLVLLCERIIPTTNPWHKAKEEMGRRASANVRLQKKRHRGSRYYGDASDQPFNQHPDNAESRATKF